MEKTMNDTKPFWLSVTFWGALFAVGAPLLAQMGIVFPTDGLADQVVSVLGGIVALYGRFRAKTNLTVAP